jgi:hypothetical protein
VNDCTERACLWIESTPSFQLEVSLTELGLREKNNLEDMEIAKRRISKMESWLADACSGRWYDTEDKLLHQKIG